MTKTYIMISITSMSLSSDVNHTMSSSDVNRIKVNSDVKQVNVNSDVTASMSIMISTVSMSNSDVNCVNIFGLHNL